MNKTKLNSNEKILLVFDTLKMCASSFTGPFLVAYFIALTVSNISSFSVYKIVANIIAVAASFIVSRIIKKFSLKNRIFFISCSFFRAMTGRRAVGNWSNCLPGRWAAC